MRKEYESGTEESDRAFSGNEKDRREVTCDGVF